MEAARHDSLADQLLELHAIEDARILIHENCDRKRRERGADKPTKLESLLARRQRIHNGRHGLLHGRPQEQSALP